MKPNKNDKMTTLSPFDQRDQSVDTQTNIGHANQVNIHTSCSASALPIHPQQIPSPSLDFTGREDEIKDILKEFDQGATIIGLRGMGGVGKTALALVLAYRLKNRFPDGQIYLNLLGMSKNALKPEEAMAHIIRSYLGIEAKLPPDQNGLGGLYRSVLSGKRALILLDNAACREQVEPLLPPKDCIALITARKKFSLPGMPEPFLLESLKPSDARELLLKICPRIGNHSEEIARLCAYLPLALRAASSLLAVKSDLNPSDYLKELGSERTRLEKIGKEGVDIDVEASLNLRYIRLPAEMASIFRQLSVFPSDFDAQAEEFICQDEDHRNLSELITWSLMEFLDSGRYRLHDLVRVFACMRQENDVSNLQMRHAEYYKEILSRINELYIRGERDAVAGREIFDTEWANIRLGQKWAEDAAFLKSGEKESKDLIPEMEPILHLCSAYASEAAYAIGMLLNPRERIHWLETALLASHLLKEAKNECAHLSNIGIAYIQVGEFLKAIDVFEQRMSLSRKIGDLLGCIMQLPIWV